MVKKFFYKNFATIIPCAILLFTILVRLYEPSIIQRERLIIFDIYQILQPRQYQSSPVKIIDIDDESLKKLGQWPWSRTIVSQLIYNLNKAGVSTIGFDIVFSETDNSSLHNELGLWKNILSKSEFKPLKNKLASIPTNDEAMAQAIAASKVVLGFSLIQQANNIQPILKSGISIAGSSPETQVLDYQGAVKNLDLFEQVAAGNGSFNIIPEIDSIIRRMPLVFYSNGHYYPSLVLELLRVSQGVSGIIIKTKPTGHNKSVIESIKVGNIVIPTDATGNLLIYYTPEIEKRTIPAWQVLQNQLVANELSGNIVLIGTSAAGLKDQRPTPLNPFAPGVEIQANVLEQLLTATYLYRPDWLMGLEISIMAIVGLVLIRLMSQLNSIIGIVVTWLFTGVAISISWYAFKIYHWLIDPVYPVITLFTLYFINLLLNYLKSEHERKYVRNAFSHYISPILVEKLVQNPEVLKLGGEMRDMSVLFCDIRGFTTISEQLNAEELTQFINLFLTSMTEVILHEKGTIDKYIGDCIMALWSAPLEDEYHAVNACYAALKMLSTLAIFNQQQKILAEQKNRPYIEVHIGIGINSGVCCVGNMGSDLRFDYSVLGDNVNLASRLEGQTKTYKVDVIISEYTLAKLQALHQAEQFAILELDVIRVKGKLQPVRIYTLLGSATLAVSTDFLLLAELHKRMMNYYYAQNWQEVILLSQQCRALNPFGLSDFYQVYQQRAKAFIDTPPESNWDGVYVAPAK
jgi:adenylate cyclase